jgi:hypothetical protein
MLEDGLPLDVALPARSITCAQAHLIQIREHLVAGVNLTITADVLHEPNAHENATAGAVTNTDLVVLTTHDHNGVVRFRLGTSPMRSYIGAQRRFWHCARLALHRIPNSGSNSSAY